jgi:hypothetical protein
MTRLAFALGLGLALSLVAQPAAAPPWQPARWSHNDYAQGRPLLDALEHDVRFVEVDVWVAEDPGLFVGHSARELTPERTLEALYLAPLERLGTRGVTLAIETKQPELVGAAYVELLREVGEHPALLANGLRVMLIGARIAADVPRPSWMLRDGTDLVSRQWGTADLARAASAAHERGLPIRVWGTPETEASWRELTALRVDLVGVDIL